MKLVRLIARLFGKSRPAQQPTAHEQPKQVEIPNLRFRPTPGNGTRVFRSRSVRGNAA